MISEVGHPGFSDAVPRYFQSSSFQKELYDRTVRLFRAMNFPVLVLQAGGDVGQPRWYYDDPKRPLTALLPQARIEFIEGAGHFTTINHPQQLTEAIARFFAATGRQSGTKQGVK
jgi:pimeloyl-ACP methyl ester carboxylesterase